MLEKIRSALRDLGPSQKHDDVPLNRSYRKSDTSSAVLRLALFVERLRDYKAAVRLVAPADLSSAISQACGARGVRRLVVPADVPAGWIPAGVTVLREPGLSNQALEQSDGVLTACALGIAQTGTIVLDCGPGQGRRVITLLPDYHLCIIREDQVVGLVPEAVARLAPSAAAPDRPITFISGPSATSDIELSRVEGVHGPRTLEVLIVAANGLGPEKE
jgi:L-lactate dehydrogenase complex protein LldG